MGIYIRVAFWSLVKRCGHIEPKAFTAGSKSYEMNPIKCENTISKIFTVRLASRLIGPAKAAILTLVKAVLGCPGREPSLTLVKQS